MDQTHTEIFSSNDAHLGTWLVYLNGVYVPCPEVTFSYGVWQIPEATLGFAPHYLLERLGAEDKLDVTIFYLDDFYDPSNPTFRLCFEGEIVGWSYTNSPHGRMMQFNAMGDIATYTQLYFFFMNTVDAAVGKATDKATDANTITQAGVFYPQSLFVRGVLSESEAPPPDIHTPFEILFNIIKGIVGSKLPANRRSIPAVNFFSRWIRKKNFVNRFVALPFFEESSNGETPGVFAIFKAAQAAASMDTMQTTLSQTVGDAGSLMDVIKTIFGVVFYELAMLPTAPCFRVRLADGVIVGPSSTDPGVDPNKLPLRLTNYFAKPQMLFAVPPTCNVIFPSMSPQITYQENYAAQPTRTYINDSFFTSLPGQNCPFTASALTVGYPPEVNAVLQRKAQEALDTGTQTAPDVVSTGRDVLVWPEEFYKGPVVDRKPIPKWYTLLMNQSRTEDQRKDLANLFNLYAQYEYFRGRYEKRGGGVSLKFNPYIVPGFPCVVFDSQTPSFHTLGYVTSITHSFSSRGSMTSSVTYSFGRTLREMLSQLKLDAERLGVVLGAAPADPVDDVRRITQDFDTAEQFYNAIFFGRQPLQGAKKASFDFREVIGYAKTGVSEESDAEAIVLTGPTQKDVSLGFIPADIAAGIGATNGDGQTTSGFNPDGSLSQPQPPVPYATKAVVQTTIDDSREFQPLPGFQSAFQSFDTAMQYVSRPICTLQEYLAFLHGGKTLDELEASGQVSGPQDDFAYASDQDTPSARYYLRIKQLRQGPGDYPKTPATGADVKPPPDGGTTPEATAYTGPRAPVPPDYPQTRQDWDSVLLAYQTEMLGTIAPKR